MPQINVVLSDSVVDKIDIMIEFYRGEIIVNSELATQFNSIMTTKGIKAAKEWLVDVERSLRRARPRSRAAFVEKCVEKFFEGEKDSPYSKELAALKLLRKPTRKNLPVRMKPHGD